MVVRTWLVAVRDVVTVLLFGRTPTVTVAGGAVVTTVTGSAVVTTVTGGAVVTTVAGGAVVTTVTGGETAWMVFVIGGSVARTVFWTVRVTITVGDTGGVAGIDTVDGSDVVDVPAGEVPDAVAESFTLPLSKSAWLTV